MDFKSDLIVEIAKFKNTNNKGYISKTFKGKYGLIITEVEVKTEECSKELGRQIGYYKTMDCKELYLFSDSIKEYVAIKLSENLTNLIKESGVDGLNNVLVVGLGNKEIMADSLGPRVVEKIIITRHLKEVVNKPLDNRFKTVSALSTGVLGTTGIETGDIIKAVSSQIKPDVVIMVDTLSTINTSKIATSFQLCNTGIVPGGGVGNHRQAINQETLGVPVIVVGMPLVVYAYSMCKEVLEKASEEIGLIEKYEEQLNEVASSVVGDLVVTIKDIDSVVDNCAFIISLAINLTINKGLSVKEIIDYMN